ncbi:hypothetical protein B0H19DRAFT_1257474 [Mycena capillaripes]|nr:hypothetical protein B0H19DRAFT_1257474 [Mycena capillaripes]
MKDNSRAGMERIVARRGFCRGIFTHGSGFEGLVGPATVRGQKHLDAEDQHTVFKAEAILALDIIAGIPRLIDVNIFMDCQSVIAALSSPKPQSSQYLLHTFHAFLGAFSARTCAKEAAQGVFSPLASRVAIFETPLSASKAATHYP